MPKKLTIAAIAAALAVAGCAANSRLQLPSKAPSLSAEETWAACALVAVAASSPRASFLPAWYDTAGLVLRACNMPDEALRAEIKGAAK